MERFSFDSDVIPNPTLHLVDFDIYRKRNFQANTIMTSRGHLYPCTFCSITAIKKVRLRSSKRIIEKMQQTYRLAKSKYFAFTDDALNIKKKFVP